MALPAEKPLSVRGEVDLGRLLSVGFFPMTLCAELPRLGLARPDAPRGSFMFRRNVMTARAADEGVRGDGLYARDLRVTGGTLAGRLRRHRIMRIMTSDTGPDRIVENGTYLGKSRRS